MSISQLNLPGFTPPTDNSESSLKKAFVFVWSFIQKIVQQFNNLVQQFNNLLSVTNTLIKGADTAWHEIGAAGQPAFQNGYTNYGGGTNTMAFRKDAFGFVHFKGSITSGTGIAFTLPSGYRPVATAACALSSGYVSIASTGTCTPSASTASWDGVTFYAGP